MDVTLIMFKENGENRTFQIRPGKTVIGRREECDLRIPLGEISRKHAMILVTDDTVTIRDLGSSNGTYVNNKRVTEQELAAGDHLVLGPVVFTLQINGEPKEIRPVQTRLEARKTLSETGALAGSGAGRTAGDIDEDDLFGDDDPISALEALAASDETAALDLDDVESDDTQL